MEKVLANNTYSNIINRIESLNRVVGRKSVTMTRMNKNYDKMFKTKARKFLTWGLNWRVIFVRGEKVRMKRKTRDRWRDFY